jgi:hypothetical protein
VLCCCSNDTVINKDINERASKQERETEKAGLEQQMERTPSFCCNLMIREEEQKKEESVEEASVRASERPFLLQPICFMAPLCQ